MTKIYDGIINVYKEKGITSAKVVSIIKHMLKQTCPNNSVKVGHFGTLDPDAQGILPIAIGKATKLFDYFVDKDKKYRVIAEFGYETDTLDATGKVVKKCSIVPTKDQIEKKLLNFIGGYKQIPPKVSAKSLHGKRAYDLFRSGIKFELEPQFVRINEIELLNYSKYLDLIISCGKGFYVRSFIKDLAFSLGALATVVSLERIETGPVNIKNSKKLDDICFEKDILSVEDVLCKLPSFHIEKQYSKKILNGVKCNIAEAPEYFKAYVDGFFIGIGEKNDGLVSIKIWLS